MKLERSFRWVFARYGRFVAKHPLPFLLFPVVITTALGIGLFTSFSKETDSENLYSPYDTQSRRNRDTIEDLYSEVVVGGHSMLPRHRTRRGSWARVITTPTDHYHNYAGILNETVLTDVFRLHDIIVDLTVMNEANTSSPGYKFSDLCLAWRGQCLENEFLVQLKYNPKRLSKTTLTYPLTKQRGGGGGFAFIGAQLGEVTLNEDDEVTQAGRLQLSYDLRHDTDVDRHRGEMWEKEFLRQMEAFHSDVFAVNWITAHSFSEELDKTSTLTFNIVAVVGAVICAFSVLSTNMLDWVRNKPLLTIAGVVSAGFALASAFGLMSYIGVPYANVTGSMPFLILGKLTGLKSMHVHPFKICPG